MWRTEFQVTGAARKDLVKALEQATGEKAKYMGVPSCAYQVGEYTVTKEGTLEYDDSIAETEETDHVYAVLADAGFKTGLEETPAEPEGPTGVLVSIPLTRHTSGTLRNLINLIYTRAGLLNKALETSFRVDGGLVERLAEEKYDT